MAMPPMILLQSPRCATPPRASSSLLEVPESPPLRSYSHTAPTPIINLHKLFLQLEFVYMCLQMSAGKISALISVRDGASKPVRV